MILPTRMLQLLAVILEPDIEPVTKMLLEAGVVDFIDTRKIAESAAIPVESFGNTVGLRDIHDLMGHIETLLPPGSMSRLNESVLDISKLEIMNIEKITATIDRLREKVESERTNERVAREEVERLADMQKQLDLFGSIEAGLKSASRFSYLSMQTGSVGTPLIERMRDALNEFPSVMVETRSDDEHTYLLLVSLKRDEKRINELLERFSWSDIDIRDDMQSVDEKVVKSIDARIGEFQAKREASSENIREISILHAEELEEYWEILKVNELFAKVRSNYSRTRRTVILSGWLPVDARESINIQIHDACNEDCYVEWRKPTEEKDLTAPVEMRNPKFLAPFELLVRNYSVPAYGTIDPTPLVAVSYLVMFGLMFGDAGHGFVLAMCGIIGRLLVKKEGGVRKILTLLVWCGGAAIVAGVLFGAYFGTQWFRPLWFDYHGVVSGHGGGELVGNIYDVLAITVYFGVTVIGMGLVLNWVNLVMKRRWFDLIFDKAGVLGGIIYGVGVWAASYFVAHDYKQLPSITILAIFIGLPALLLALKAPLKYFEQKRHDKAKPFQPLMVVDFFMEWIVEILEVFSGYLANTLSFMRVAGLGIAHEALMIAFFSIARMAGGGSITIVSVLILLLGNLLVILLEGLSAGIQSLRLNYYEFFSKYFTSAGRAYRPVSLRMDNNKEK